MIILEYRFEKVVPFVIFLVCSICSMIIAGYGIYVVVMLFDF